MQLICTCDKCQYSSSALEKTRKEGRHTGLDFSVRMEYGEVLDLIQTLRKIIVLTAKTVTHIIALDVNTQLLL